MDAIVETLMKKLFVELEASGRHVHLTEKQVQTLFGHSLTPQRALSQPGQFLARERVTVIGPKGRFSNVAVLGPARKDAQVEISLTDGKLLGIVPPVRQSGDTKNTPGVRMEGPAGAVELAQGVIAARRHLHLTKADAARFHVVDGQTVRLQTYTARPVIFEDVVVRVSDSFACRAHLDFDEANACGFAAGDLGRILP